MSSLETSPRENAPSDSPLISSIRSGIKGLVSTITDSKATQLRKKALKSFGWISAERKSQIVINNDSVKIGDITILLNRPTKPLNYKDAVSGGRLPTRAEWNSILEIIGPDIGNNRIDFFYHILDINGLAIEHGFWIQQDEKNLQEDSLTYNYIDYSDTTEGELFAVKGIGRKSDKLNVIYLK